MREQTANSSFKPPLTNEDIASRLMSLAQLLAARRENPYKVKAYRRAAKAISNMGESVDELVRNGADLTRFPGIGEAIQATVYELVSTGKLKRLEALRTDMSPEIVAISDFPLLDPKRILRIYKKLGISTIDALKERLERGEILREFGLRMEQHVRRGLADTKELLWYEAEKLSITVEDYLRRCGARSAEVVGEFRRKLEIIPEVSFLVEVDDFGDLIRKVRRYGGRAEPIRVTADDASFKLPSGISLTIFRAARHDWGLRMIEATGSAEHVSQLQSRTPGLNKLRSSRVSFPTEQSAYEALGLTFIEPELREGTDEVRLASTGSIPDLVTVNDIRGELHAHTVSSDGANSIEEMAGAAQDKGLGYIGISDHSQSLKIAGGMSEADLWEQIRYIDTLNERMDGIRILKGAEVDILQDGSLDYSESLLKELDYTICSIHSRFGMNRSEQTERILRAMDNRSFNILGHATGRLLLKRPGYEIDFERLIEHARANNCHFELNSSPDRLDVSAANARVVSSAGVGIVVTTDAHSTRELNYLRLGIDQARRAGLSKEKILNHLEWPALKLALRR
jgi:DNA polymerase (family X)